jgi:arsenate reductase
MAPTGSLGEYSSDEELVRHTSQALATEFEGTFSAETITRFVTESLADVGNARVKNFVPLFVYRFAKERLRALGQAEGTIMKEKPEVLFVCVHNAGRSQMAAGLLDKVSGGRVHVRSAGSTPASEIHDNVRKAMEEIGVDLSKEFPKPLTDEVVRAADVVITMGCGDACPIYPGKRYMDWEVEDPAGKDLETVRAIRADMTERVRELVEELVPSSF